MSLECGSCEYYKARTYYSGECQVYKSSPYKHQPMCENYYNYFKKKMEEYDMGPEDEYVRDHLLIQFMLENYTFILSFSEQGRKFEEEIYRNWKNWLKYLEVKNDKRSEI